MVGDVRVLRLAEHAEGDDEVGAGEGEIDKGGKQREGARKNEQKREARKSEHGEGQEHAGEVGAFGERPFAARCRHHRTQVEMHILPAQRTGDHPAEAVEQLVECDADGDDQREMR